MVPPPTRTPAAFNLDLPNPFDQVFRLSITTRTRRKILGHVNGIARVQLLAIISKVLQELVCSQSRVCDVCRRWEPITSFMTRAWHSSGPILKSFVTACVRILNRVQRLRDVIGVDVVDELLLRALECLHARLRIPVWFIACHGVSI